MGRRNGGPSFLVDAGQAADLAAELHTLADGIEQTDRLATARAGRISRWAREVDAYAGAANGTGEHVRPFGEGGTEHTRDG